LAPTFSVYAFRFHFRAGGRIAFPPGKAGNLLRGAFGSELRRIACVPECTDTETCARRGECPYARVFAPQPMRPGASGLRDLPRPYVFRAAHLDGCTVQPGDRFAFGLHLFHWRDPELACFRSAFSELARAGLGAARSPAMLERIEQVGEDGTALGALQDGEEAALHKPLPPIEVPLGPEPTPVHRIRVLFLTPTELKTREAVACEPGFAALFGRARDRVANLRALYGPGPPELDFAGLGRLARDVKLSRFDGWHEPVTRRSSRTGQVHPIGGLRGEAEYEGGLAPFLGILRAAQWTGVGRQTVWGKGAIAIEVPRQA
jgi:hypothetical protein